MTSSLLTPPSLFEKTLALLEELTAISSPSGDSAGLLKAAQLYGEALTPHGLAVEILDEDDADGQSRPVLYARGPAAGDRHMLVIGHLDTVLPAAPPKRRDGKLWATGAIDMKGGLAAFVGALDGLAAAGKKAPEDLLIVLVPDEEVAGTISRRVVETLGAAARTLWVLEPGQSGGAEGSETAVVGRRGMFGWRLETRGQGAHAGNAYWQGRSALLAAADWCLRARQLAAPGEGPTINAGRMVAGDEGFVSQLAAAAGLVGTPQQVNVVPNLARVDGEARYLRAADERRLQDAFAELAEQIAKEHEVEIELRYPDRVAPVDPLAADRELSQRAVRLAAERGWRLELEEQRGGISFPNFLPDPGAIPVLDGLGPIGGGMHTREEFIDLRSLDRRIALLTDLLEAG